MRYIFQRALITIVAVLILGAALYSGLRVYDAFQADKAAQAAEAARRAENSEKLADALIHKAGITQLRAQEGFWYAVPNADGGEDLFFYDPAAWAARSDLDDETVDTFAQIVKLSRVSGTATAKPVAEADLPEWAQFHNKLYALGAPGDFAAIESALVKKIDSGNYASDDLWELAYLYELKGQYAKRDTLDARNCSEFKQRCADQVALTVRGKVVDTGGRPIQGAHVSVLSKDTEKAVVTDKDGVYVTKFSAKPQEKVRIRAVKRNFSDGVTSLLVLGEQDRSYGLDPIILGSPITIITIDTKAHTVTSPGSTANSDGSFLIQGENSSYQIPAGAIVHEDGSAYSGPVDVYLYEFTADTVPQNLTNIDTFDQVMGYAGNLMKSFGMPYIQFFTPSGEELHVMRSRSMVLTYKIADMEALRTNAAKIYGPLTDADMKILVDSSIVSPGFPIDRDFLIEHRLLRFPAFWVFDRQKGVWENIGIRVLDIDGTIQSLFYTINDQ